MRIDAAEQLKRDEKLSTVYGLAHGGKSLFWAASELLFAYFLTEGCGLPPRQMGVILGASLLLSAVFDLAVGWRLSRHIVTVADAGRMQWFGAVASGLSFVAFGFAGLVPVEDRFAFALVTLVAFRLAYTFLDNPQNALLSMAPVDDDGRVCLTAVRYVYGGTAGIIVAAAFVPLLKAKTSIMDAGSFAVFAGLLAIVAIASAFFLRRMLDRRDPVVPEYPSADAVVPLPLTRRGPPIFIMMFVVSAAISTFARLEPYFVSYSLGSAQNGGLLLVCVAGGSVVSQPWWRRLALQRSLLVSLRLAAVVLLAGGLSFGIAALTGVFGAALSGLVYGAGTGGVLMSLWALAATSADDAPKAVSATQTFGKLAFAAKLALGLSALGIGEILAAADYRSGGDGVILALMSSVPVIGGLGCLALSYTPWSANASWLSAFSPRRRRSSATRQCWTFTPRTGAAAVYRSTDDK